MDCCFVIYPVSSPLIISFFSFVFVNITFSYFDLQLLSFSIDHIPSGHRPVLRPQFFMILLNFAKFPLGLTKLFDSWIQKGVVLPGSSFADLIIIVSIAKVTQCNLLTQILHVYSIVLTQYILQHWINAISKFKIKVEIMLLQRWKWNKIRHWIFSFVQRRWKNGISYSTLKQHWKNVAQCWCNVARH